MLVNRDMIVYFSGKIIPALSSLVMMWLGIRYIGEAGYGKYILLFNSVTLITAFTAGWMQQAILRFDSKAESNTDIYRNPFYRRSAVSSSTFSLIIMILVSVLYFKLGYIYSLFTGILAASFCYYSIGLTGLQAQFKSTNYALSETIFGLGGIIFTVFFLLVISRTGFSSLLGAILAGCILSIGIGIIPGLKSNNSPAKYNHELTLKYLKFGLPLTIWLFISNLFNLADRFIIEYYFGLTSVGTYSAVYDFIYKISGFLCMPILLTFHPLITSNWNQDRKEASMELIRKAIKFEVILTLGLLVISFFGGQYFFTNFIGIKSDDLNYLILPLVLSSMLWQMALLLHKPLELYLATKKMLIGILISLVINVLLNIILMPKFGYKIGAFTTLIGTLSYFIYTYIINKTFKKAV